VKLLPLLIIIPNNFLCDLSASLVGAVEKRGTMTVVLRLKRDSTMMDYSDAWLLCYVTLIAGEQNTRAVVAARDRVPEL